MTAVLGASPNHRKLHIISPLGPSVTSNTANRQTGEFKGQLAESGCMDSAAHSVSDWAAACSAGIHLTKSGKSFFANKLTRLAGRALN